jgi:hypothetical protein
MKCTAVRPKLAGYLDDAITGAAQVHERVRVREHLEGCASCREELQRFRKLAVLLSRVPRSLPPADLAVRIRVAAAQSVTTQDISSRLRKLRDRAEILLENVFRPITVPATGGFVSAILVFVVVLQLIVPGITVRAVQNDVPLNILRPAERKPGRPNSTIPSWPCPTVCSSTSPWMPMGKWPDTRFFPGRRARICVISSIRCCSSRASARC